MFVSLFVLEEETFGWFHDVYKTNQHRFDLDIKDISVMRRRASSSPNWHLQHFWLILVDPCLISCQQIMISPNMFSQITFLLIPRSSSLGPC
jgi:hypothetical protein